jgi:transcriptional regulator GlxA family with amidase domain
MAIMRKNRAMHRIAVLPLANVVAFDLGTPPQVFNAARDEHDQRLYEVVVCGDPVRSTGGFTVVPEHGWDAVATADTVIIPGVDLGRPVEIPAEVVEALNGHKGRKISICTGASVFAQLGFLDDRPAASHWAWSDLLRTKYPQVK